MSKINVVVVGAGVAGLQAARTLKARGIQDVTILEASHHIGGRCNCINEKDIGSVPSEHSPFLPVILEGVTVPAEDRLGAGEFNLEMGSEFVHGTETSIYKLGKEKNWKMHQLFTWAQGDGGPSESASPDGGAGYYWVDGIMYRFDELPADLRQANDALETMTSEADIATDPTITAYSVLQKRGLSRGALSLLEAGYANSAGDNLRSLSWAMCCRAELGFDSDGPHDFRIVGGFTNVLVGALSEGLDIKTRHAVIKVDQSNVKKKVEISCANGAVFVADFVVMAVPVPLLQGNHAEKIAFNPTLPDWKLEALAQVKAGDGFKVHIKLNKRVFPPDMHGIVCAGCMFPEIWVDSSGSGPLDPQAKYLYVTGFCMGSWASRCGNVQPAKLISLFLDQLEEIFQAPDLRAHYCGGVIIDWARVPYIRAGYTPATIMEDRWTRIKLGERTGRVFWAGEAMNPTQYTTVHGAMDSGATAANAIAETIVAASRSIMARVTAKPVPTPLKEDSAPVKKKSKSLLLKGSSSPQSRL